jgi:PAS domain S-box-containing protein
MENSKISIQPVALEIVKEASALYKKAEKLLFERQALKEVVQNDEEALSLYHQMKVHLIELEMQIEELRLANEKDESEVAKYRSIFENMQDAYYEASPDGVIIEISNSIEIISKGQYTREEVLGKSLISFYEHSEERIIFYNELLKEGSISDYDVSLLNRDGSTVNVAISSRLVNNDKGVPIKIIGSIRDISHRKQAEADVVRLLKNENLLSKISKRTLYASELDDFLNFSLAEMGESFQVSRVYMFDHMHATNTMDNSHEWCATGVTPQIDELQGIPLDAMPWWIETLINEHIICFSDIEKIPDEVTKEILRPQNILSILVVPVFTGGRYSGFIGFDNCNTHREWQQDEREILHSISHIIAGFIERKRAEMALEESVEQLNIYNRNLEDRVEIRAREIYRLSHQQMVINENAGLAIISTDTAGIIQTFNSAAEIMLGYKASEVIGKVKVVQFHDPAELLMRALELSQITGEEIKPDFELFSTQINLMLTNTAEWTYVRKDKSKFPVKLTISLFEDTDGSIGGYIGVAMDISKEKSVLNSLQRSEAENKAILSAIPDLMFRLNRHGIFLSAHYYSSESLYAPEDIFLGKNLHDVLPSEIGLQAENALEQSFLTNETVTFEYELLIKGEKHYFENRIQAISEEEALSIVRDISQRKHAEMALLWNEEFLKKMTESSPLAFLVVDNRTDEILFINHQFCEIWGICHLEERIRLGELKNNDIIPDCLPVLKDVPAFAESCKPLQFEDNRIIVEDEIPFADGRTIRRFSTQIRDIADQYHGRLYIFEDISRRKSSEKLVQIQRDLVTKLSATSDLQEALTFMLDSVYQIAEIDAGGIYLFNEQTGNLDLIVHKGLSEEFINEKSSFSPNSNHAKLVREGKPIYGRYQPDVFPFLISKSENEIQSLAVIPILHEGKVIGSFNLASCISSSFYAFMQSSIESLAMQIGGTIFRIKAEKALLSSQQNFRLLFDTIDDFMFILDLNGNILHTNSAVGKRLGYTNEELNQLHVLAVHPPERRDEAGFIVGEMLAGRASFCPVPLHAKDGSEIPVETRVIMGKWDGHDVLFGISRDVTERQRLDAALKMQSAAFETFAHAIIITDIEGRIQWANSSFLRLSGYQMDEIIGRTNGELTKSGQQNKLFYKELWSTIKNGKIWSGELINQRKNGTLYPEELSITPVLDELGKIRNFIAIKIDITDRKAFEESLRSAIAKEKELNELKSRFVSMASHEFRTPLASILMMSDSLMAYWKRMEEQQIELKLKNIKDQVQHLAKVVTDVMQVSKIQEGKLSFEPKVIDFIQLCNGVIKDFNTDQTLKHKIHFECNLPNLRMRLDSRLILQVLNNLVSNAVKYSHPNPVVTIKLKECNHEFQLSIKDNGIGIPPSDHKNMFEPFFRAENAKQIPGNGLGLNIVRESIRLHGGDIGFTSNLGKGTTFVVHLSKELVVEN